MKLLCVCLSVVFYCIVCRADVVVRTDVLIPSVNGTEGGVFVGARIDRGGCDAVKALGIFFIIYPGNSSYIVTANLGEFYNTTGVRKLFKVVWQSQHFRMFGYFLILLQHFVVNCGLVSNYYRLPYSFIHSKYFYSASSSPLLLRGATDYSIDSISELTRRSATGN